MAGADESVSSPKPKKKGKALLILAPIVLLILIGGGVGGFLFVKKLGPFAKKSVPAAPEKPKIAKKRVTPPPSAATTLVKTLPSTTKLDPEEGAAKLAKLWNEVDSKKLLAIAKDWKDPELARVTAKMDPAKVAEILSALPPKRASSLSREMQRLASIVPIDG